MFKRDFFLGFIKIHILYHATREPIYGLGIIEELARHGYQISPGTLYPTLKALEHEGYLTVQKKVVDGRVRKYYRATQLGQEALAEARIKVKELVNEIF